MRRNLFPGALVALSLFVPPVAVADEAEIESLRLAIEELRADYDQRISDLERRLAIAEQNAAAADYMAEQAMPAVVGEASNPAAFNPAIGVILQGQAWNYARDPGEYSVQGFPYGGEAGLIGEGVGLAETEIIMNANVDDKFTGWLTAALAIEDGESIVEIEEAWVEATALPAGFGAKFGRFFSGIGYLNSKHSHSWDFADQPLPYQAFLGGQYFDDGLQLRWLAPTDLYMEFGGEAMQGGRYPAAADSRDGIGAYTLFVNIGGDVSANSSWLAGASWLDADAIDRPSGDEDEPLFFTGDSNLAGVQFVWKWAPQGNWKQRNLVVQTEFFQRHEDGTYQLSDTSVAPYDVRQDGWYVQSVYQPIPRWRFGARYDQLSTENPGPLFDGTLLAAPADDPRRFSVMMDWSNSEFSRLRLQYTRDEAGPANDNQWGLQYIYSIGAHGAHTF